MEFRKKEGLSQMKLTKNCGTAQGILGGIEVGWKFPSI